MIFDFAVFLRKPSHRKILKTTYVTLQPIESIVLHPYCTGGRVMCDFTSFPEFVIVYSMIKRYTKLL